MPIIPASEPPMTWTDRTVGFSFSILDRMESAALKVRERLLRTASALGDAGIPFAVCGGNAVVPWLVTIDEGAVRNTRDIDLLVRRSDLDSIKTTLEQAGFVFDIDYDVVLFRNGPDGKPSEGIYLLFAGEKTRSEHLLPLPEMTTVEDAATFPVIALESLVTMKLMSNRDKDRTHPRDLSGAGLIDSNWPMKLPRELADRLQQILDTPDA